MTDKRMEIEYVLLDMYNSIGMDKPENHEDILQFCYEDVDETADPIDWSSGDVTIAFRRWIESNPTTQD
jgi:hypothetical protein